MKTTLRTVSELAVILTLLAGFGIQRAAAQNSEDIALPPDVSTNYALTEVLTMAQAGVSDDVLTNYIGNSYYPFNLTPDDLIYLKDIGIPDDVTTAMIQRDAQLGQTTSASNEAAETSAPAAPPSSGTVSVDYFYGSLAPYGTWVYIEGYGRCWRPAVEVFEPEWRPYCDEGHWVWTDDGWFWDSDYSWGWAPFHYGRWFWHAGYGWCWWPETVWAPSWVCWRFSDDDDYCGWAPLPPRCYYRAGGLFYNGATVSVNFSFGFSAGDFVFVPTRRFCDPDPWRYRLRHEEGGLVYRRSTVINHFEADPRTHEIVNRGIQPQRITAVTHQTIHQVTIQQRQAPLAHGAAQEGNVLAVNRPHFTGHPTWLDHRDARPPQLPTGFKPVPLHYQHPRRIGQTPQPLQRNIGNPFSSNPAHQRPSQPLQPFQGQPNQRFQRQPEQPFQRQPGQPIKPFQPFQRQPEQPVQHQPGQPFPAPAQPNRRRELPPQMQSQQPQPWPQPQPRSFTAPPPNRTEQPQNRMNQPPEQRVPPRQQNQFRQVPQPAPRSYSPPERQAPPSQPPQREFRQYQPPPQQEYRQSQPQQPSPNAGGGSAPSGRQRSDKNKDDHGK
ncbi:MAG: hypothetical protein KGJ88_10990 [Verrucomicrobiota bacterium]|nr:hypothetical protein [Verrucomicrobiota bacterium]